MPLEAVMVCIDNSEYTRNGDYPETRFQSQTDAVNLICGAKTNQHPENAVGILCSAGDRVEVVLTPTDQLGKIVAELPKIRIRGNNDVLRGIQTAQLALKHRQNKNQKQRIIAFVGSPVLASDKELETLGKNLKKNNVSIDLVSFGEVDENSAKLNKLLAAVNSSESSHLVEVPVGPKMLSDVLLSSVIVNPDGEMAAGGGGAGGDAGFEFGIDPGNDPELALALRISMEEERARQQQAEGGAPAADAGGAAPAVAPAGEAAAPAATAAPPPPSGAAPAADLPMASADDITAAMGMEDMDEELRQALMLSLQEAGPMEVDNAAAPAATAAPEPPKAAEPLAPSAAATAPPAAAAASTAAAPAAAALAAPAEAAKEDAKVEASWFQDPSFVQELLGSLPGVDISDPRIQAALTEVKGDEKKDDEKKDGSGGGSGSGGK